MNRGQASVSVPAAPQATLRVREAVAITVGIVVGAGIFRTPSLVAGATGSAEIMLAAWALGGLISLVGALCYAELASTYPNAGGDYHFLTRAFGRRLGFLYAWARLSVIQTGSIALLAFAFGDYMSELFNIGPFSSALWAGAAVAALTAVHWVGVRAGTGFQNWLTALEVLGLAAVIVAGLLLTPAAPVGAAGPAGQTQFGMVMVFVLLTYGGWNEAAYVSAELKDAPRRMAPVLIASLLLITVLYLLANAAYLRTLGLAGMAGSDAVAADVMRLAFGPVGVVLISLCVAIAALTSANATLFTGARTAYALGRDHPALRFLGHWEAGDQGPRNAVLAQGAIALLLVGLGAATRKGFQTAVDYTAPVFWLFFLLVGISLFMLRRKDPETPRPFRVPLYPVLPALFCLTNAYLLWSSLAYVRLGALVGLAVLAAGVLLMIPLKSPNKEEPS